MIRIITIQLFAEDHDNDVEGRQLQMIITRGKDRCTLPAIHPFALLGNLRLLAVASLVHELGLKV